MRETAPVMLKYKTAKFRFWMTVLATFIGLMTTIALAEFIQEEAIQAQVFSCSTFKAAGSPKNVLNCAKEVERQAKNLHKFTNTLGAFNPISNSAYRQYAKSSLWQAKSFESWAKKYWDSHHPEFIVGEGYKDVYYTDSGRSVHDFNE